MTATGFQAHETCDHAYGYCAEELDNRFRSREERAREELQGYYDSENGEPRNEDAWAVSQSYRNGWNDWKDRERVERAQRAEQEAREADAWAWAQHVSADGFYFDEA